MLGREKLFEVRRTHNDVTFLDTFLTEDFCRPAGLLHHEVRPKTGEWVRSTAASSGDVKKQLLEMLASRGTPRVYVKDANAFNRGELLLDHEHEGLDIQLDWANITLQNLVALCGAPVHLETLLDGKAIRITHDGTAVTRDVLKKVGR
jgi:stage V sporulation protein R